MSGRLLELARGVIKKVVFNSDMFTTDITITDKEGEIYAVKGLAIVHSILNDLDGTGKFQSRGDTSSITFVESDLTDLGAVTRKTDGTFSMSGWLASFTLPSGDYTAIVSETLPDSTLGVIRCLINVYGED